MPSKNLVDWTIIYKKYKGKWVAVKDDKTTVITSGDTLDEVLKNAANKGYDNPPVFHVPKKLGAFVG